MMMAIKNEFAKYHEWKAASKRVWDDADRKGKDYVETDSIA
jgi:hypothetical protein